MKDQSTLIALVSSTPPIASSPLGSVDSAVSSSVGTLIKLIGLCRHHHPRVRGTSGKRLQEPLNWKSIGCRSIGEKSAHLSLRVGMKHD